MKHLKSSVLAASILVFLAVLAINSPVRLTSQTASAPAPPNWRSAHQPLSQTRNSPAFTVGPNQNAPVWTAVDTLGMATDFNYYFAPDKSPVGNTCKGSPYNCEIMGATGEPAPRLARIHTPNSFGFTFQTPTPAEETAFGGCAITNNLGGDGIYYYSPATHNSIAGTYVYPPISEFNISTMGNNASGMVVQGATKGMVAGEPSTAYALAVAYVTSNRCSAGDIEYGFFQDLTGNLTDGNPGEVVFYFSQYTNCDGYAECRNNATGWNTSQPIYQHTSPYTKFTGITGSGTSFYYSAYIIPVTETSITSLTGYAFRVQMLDQKQNLATCQINGESAGVCTVDVPISYATDGTDNILWPVEDVLNGPSYLVDGTQSTSNLTSANRISYSVNGVWLGFP